MQIRIEAKIAAKISKAWDCYTQPQHITKWNFADDSWHCPHAENDLREGGKYLARMEAKDGSFGFDFEATYELVQVHKLLRYRLGDHRMVEISFTELGNECQVVVIFDAETENPVEMQRQGWQAILDNFKKHTEAF